MKGKMKKLFALALAAIMVLAMGITALAGEVTTPNPSVPTGSGEDGKYKLTITNPLENHEYKVYQIYTGDVSVKDGKGVLSNIKKGSALDGTGTALSQAEMDTLESNVNGLEFAKELAERITSNTTVAATLTKENPTADLVGGYYLVKDVWAGGNDVPAGETFSDFVLSIVGATTFAPKTLQVPNFTKTAGDSLTVVSDKKIGETIDFTLTATLPSDFGSHDAYKLVFKDELSNGLTYTANSIKVAVNGNEVTDVNVPEFEGQKLEYTIDNVFEFAGLTKATATEAVITVTYSATINENALKGTGETNKATLEYTNGSDTDGLGSSTPSVVTVLTVGLDITKVDGDNENVALAGAEFALYAYKEDADNKRGDEIARAKVTLTDIENPDGNKFMFGGLAKGKYVLVETKTPTGYNTMNDMIVEIDFDSVEGSDGVVTIKDLSVTTTETVDANNKVVAGSQAWSQSETVNVVQTSIANYKGVQLPSTGGIGTTIFYVVGGILVVGAGILLITKKRMSKSN